MGNRCLTYPSRLQLLPLELLDPVSRCGSGIQVLVSLYPEVNSCSSSYCTPCTQNCGIQKNQLVNICMSTWFCYIADPSNDFPQFLMAIMNPEMNATFLRWTANVFPIQNEIKIKTKLNGSKGSLCLYKGAIAKSWTSSY